MTLALLVSLALPAAADPLGGVTGVLPVGSSIQLSGGVTRVNLLRLPYRSGIVFQRLIAPGAHHTGIVRRTSTDIVRIPSPYVFFGRSDPQQGAVVVDALLGNAPRQDVVIRDEPPAIRPGPLVSVERSELYPHLRFYPTSGTVVLPQAPIPEPGSIGLFVLGGAVVGIAVARRRRARSSIAQ